jgi:hypothetical protein
VGRIEMLDQHEGHARIDWQMAQQLRVGLQAPRGRSYADNVRETAVRAFPVAWLHLRCRGVGTYGCCGGLPRRARSSLGARGSTGPTLAALFFCHTPPLPFSPRRAIVVTGTGAPTYFARAMPFSGPSLLRGWVRVAGACQLSELYRRLALGGRPGGHPVVVIGLWNL